jgi:hypothetical protein
MSRSNLATGRHEGPSQPKSAPPRSAQSAGEGSAGETAAAESTEERVRNADGGRASQK